MDQTKPVRPLHMTRTNSTVPGLPRLLLVTSFLSQPLHHPDPPWTTQSLPELSDRLSLLKDLQLCSKSNQTNSGYLWLQTILATNSMPIASSQTNTAISLELPWTSQSLSDHSKQPGHSPGPPAWFHANQELCWPLCT